MLERTDKIGLIVASVLVVLLAAGGGALLYKRSANGPAAVATAESSVTLSPMGDSELPAIPKPKPAPAPAKPPRVPKGSSFGYVTKVGTSGLSLRWDLAELLTGAEADLYAKKQGKVMADASYYIANDTHKVEIYDVAPNALIQVVDGGQTKTIKPAELKKRYDARPGDIKDATWIAVIKGGKVSSLKQVVLPPAKQQS